jgi:hypothetical protein
MGAWVCVKCGERIDEASRGFNTTAKEYVVLAAETHRRMAEKAGEPGHVFVVEGKRITAKRRERVEAFAETESAGAEQGHAKRGRRRKAAVEA